jgi:acetyl-CoA carboxylase carboxyl transferase subunit alpha
LTLGVPLVSLITGEGMSGGAIAIAAGDRIIMLEHSIYSVISPEGCASILWRDPARAKDAANAMRITAMDLSSLKIVDGVVPEPPGGAHRHSEQVIAAVGDAVEAALKELAPLGPAQLIAQRRERFLAIGREGLS